MKNRLKAAFSYKHLNWVLLDQVVVSGANFATTIIVARFLGVDGFGYFSLAWMAVLFMSGIQAALIISPMMSIEPKIEAIQKKSYYGVVFLQQFLLALFIAFSIYICLKISAYFFHDWGGRLALELAVASFFFLAHDFIRRFFFVRLEFKKVFLNDILRYIGQLFLLLILFANGYTTVEMALWVVTGASAVAWFIALIKIEELTLNWPYFLLTLRRHWLMSKWLVGSAVVQWSAGNVFVLLAAAMIGVSAAGGLKAMQNLLGVFNVLFSALENIIPVRASEIYSNGGKKMLVHYLLKVAILGGGATLACMTFIMVAPSFWIELVYGELYLGYENILIGYGVVYVFTFISLIYRIAFRTIEYTRPIFQAYFFSAILSFIIVYPLISVFGANGVVVGLILVQIAILMLYVLISKRKKLFDVGQLRF